MTYRSPSFDTFAAAVPPPEGSIDAGVPWHYGEPHREQRSLAEGLGCVDQSHLAVLAITGADRWSWLHSLTTAHLTDGLVDQDSATALILDPHGHVEHELHLVDDGVTTWCITEPGSAPALLDYLDRMRFLLDVAVRDATNDWAVVWRPTRRPEESGLPTWLIAAEFAGSGTTPAGSDRGGDASKYLGERPATLPGAQVLVPRADLPAYLSSHQPVAGTWALEALRAAAAVPRMGLETDHRTLPHEVGWIGPAVHLAKGCYRGQETVARVHNMGRPPRTLVLLQLDGSQGELPNHGDPVELTGRTIGFVGTAAWHYELGPIATAIVKRSTPHGAQVSVGGIAATVDTVVSG